MNHFKSTKKQQIKYTAHNISTGERKYFTSLIDIDHEFGLGKNHTYQVLRKNGDRRLKDDWYIYRGTK
jgi:hypothetical protein